MSETATIPKAEEVKAEGANPLVSGTVCLLVHFKRPGIRRKLRDDQYVAGTADKALTGAQKVILDAPEYKQIAAYEGHVKAWLESKALPNSIYRWSSYLIPISSLKVVDGKLKNEFLPEWGELVDQFMAVVPERKAETMKRLGTIGDESDYKSMAELRASFGFEYEYVTMQTPSTLKQIDIALYEREEQRFQERFKTLEGEVVEAYREKFSLAVQDMKDILDGQNKDGKAKRFHGWKIAKLQKYIADFKAEMNVCGDAALVTEMDTASKLLSGVDPKELKDDAKWRASLSASFAEIGKKLETMTRVRGKRLIDTDEEEEGVA